MQAPLVHPYGQHAKGTHYHAHAHALQFGSTLQHLALPSCLYVEDADTLLELRALTLVCVVSLCVKQPHLHMASG